MSSFRLWILLLLALFSTMACGQSQTVTITEPGVYNIRDLFNTASIVAVVKGLSRDTENYEHDIYKGSIIRSFKGPPIGEVIYFGPFDGERLGWEYVLFLKSDAKPANPKTTVATSYGTVRYSQIFNEGYSSMETSYQCVFPGKEVREQCDHAVRICTDYIKLPKSVPAFSFERNEPPFGCRWARKSTFLSLLETLGGPQK